MEAIENNIILAVVVLSAFCYITATVGIILLILRSSSSHIDKTLKNLKHTTQTLDNETIKKQGLICALRNEISRLNISGLFIIKTNFAGEVRKMDDEKKLQVFRVAQEALHTIVMHSKSKVVDLSFSYYNDYIGLIITDNDVGYEYRPGNNSSKDSDFNYIKTRAQPLKGAVSIISDPHRGTSICIYIPYNDKTPIPCIPKHH